MTLSSIVRKDRNKFYMRVGRFRILAMRFDIDGRISSSSWDFSFWKTSAPPYDCVVCPTSTSLPTKFAHSSVPPIRLTPLLASELGASENRGPKRKSKRFRAVEKLAAKYSPPPQAIPTAALSLISTKQRSRHHANDMFRRRFMSFELHSTTWKRGKSYQVAAAVVMPWTRWWLSPVTGSFSLDLTIRPAPKKPTPEGIEAETRLESHDFCFVCDW